MKPDAEVVDFVVSMLLNEISQFSKCMEAFALRWEMYGKLLNGNLSAQQIEQIEDAMANTLKNIESFDAGDEWLNANIVL